MRNTAKAIMGAIGLALIVSGSINACSQGNLRNAPVSYQEAVDYSDDPRLDQESRDLWRDYAKRVQRTISR